MADLRILSLFFFLFVITLAGQPVPAGEGMQSQIDRKAAPSHHLPRVVLYSVSWCPHCKEAKEYLTSHNIPFINKDVELDGAAMEELTSKYKSQGVPVIVIGDDEMILKGFNREKFEHALQQAKKNPQ